MVSRLEPEGATVKNPGVDPGLVVVNVKDKTESIMIELARHLEISFIFVCVVRCSSVLHKMHALFRCTSVLFKQKIVR